MFVLPSDLKLRSNMRWKGAPEPGITDGAFPKSVKSIYFTCSPGKEQIDNIWEGNDLSKRTWKVSRQPFFLSRS